MAEVSTPMIPSPPPALREAAQLGTLIPFVGAGVSQLAGCPDWPTLATQCLDVFVDRGKLSYAAKEQLGRIPNPRVKLSLATELQAVHGVEIPFEALLHPKAREDHENGRRLYSSLSRLGNTFVTTNYDRWLDDRLPETPPSILEKSNASTANLTRPRKVYFRPEDLTAAHLNEPDTVIHLHGSVREPGGMVVTMRQYLSHYANDRRSGSENPVLTFLEDLFQLKTVLFIGYGLNELEILEYVMLKSRATSGMQAKHFLLQGYYRHELELMTGMQRYLRACGIELLPYILDEKG